MDRPELVIFDLAGTTVEDRGEVPDAFARALGDVTVCGDDVRQGRPAPYLIFRAMEAAGALEARTVANVGDTALDLQAGAHADVRWNLGVLSGAHDRATLEQAPHTYILPSIADLAALWRLG